MHPPVPQAERPPHGTQAAPLRPGRASLANRVRRWAGPAAFLLVLAVLFAAYLRLSRTYPENSDEANILLMASDLAHGNLTLSGWNTSDVPFITTELPEMALLVKLFGLRLETAHIAAALTYTTVVAVALLLAKGRTGGRTAAVRMAVACAILLAPQPGVGVFVLIFSVGHIGTAAPVMLSWLVIDRCWPAAAAAPPPRRRWPLPAAAPVLPACALLAWALIADPLVLVIGVGPLLLITTVRLVTDFNASPQNERVLHRVTHAVSTGRVAASVAASAVLAYLAAWCAKRLLAALGGYTQQPVPFTVAPVSTWYPHSLTVAHGLLEMFGAFPVPGNAINYLGPGDYALAPPLSGLPAAVAVTRLACVALAVAAAWLTARRFLRPGADLVSQLLLAGLVANLAAYIPSSLADHTALNAREFAPVLPFAAVLAARNAGGLYRISRSAAGRLGMRPPGGRVVTAALCALLAWYGLGLLAEASIPAAPDPFTRVAAFLRAHHLTDGIGGYWDASVITVDTGGAVTVRAVTAGCLQPYAWESKPAWYDPAGATATFVIESTRPGYFSRWQAWPAALADLGALVPAARPAALRPGGGFTVRAYRANLLAELPLLAHC